MSFKLKTQKLLVLATSVGFILLSSLAIANLKISNVKVTMQGKSATIKLTNTDTKNPLTFNVYAEKVMPNKSLDATKDIVAFPGVIKIKPGKTRVVRIMLRHKATKDQMYRLFLYEKPNIAAADKLAREKSQLGDTAHPVVAFGLKVSIPVHVVAQK